MPRVPEITECRIQLATPLPNVPNDYLRAWARITIDDSICIRELKVIEVNGRLFVAFPGRHITDHCPHCSWKNRLKARFCGWCGVRLADGRTAPPKDGHDRNHIDFVHPVNHETRRHFERVVLAAYLREIHVAPADRGQAVVLNQPAA